MNYIPTTFAAECQCASKRAIDQAFPYTPSRAEYEAELTAMIDRLTQDDQTKVKTYVQETFKHVGLMPIAVQMLKDRMK